MKKFFEKHDLVKITFGMILLTVILSWVVKQGYFNAGELTKSEITRIGIFDLTTYGLLGMYYFTVLVTFLFVTGAFYQFLSKLGAYQKLTDKISKRWKGKEILFSLIISFVFAALASMINEYIVLIAFMPFVITILSKMKVDRIGSYVTTFGAMLVGLLGNTIGQKIAGMNVQYFTINITDNLLEKILIFVIAYVIYSLFNVMHLKKILPDNKEKNTIICFFAALLDLGLLVLFLFVKMLVFYIVLGVSIVLWVLYILYIVKFSKKKSSKKKTAKSKKAAITEPVISDMFENTIKGSEKSNTIPLIIVGVIAIIVTILAYIPWNTVFGVDWFSTALTKVNETNIFGVPLFSYILGNVNEFGSWDIFGVQAVMLLSILVLQICYKVSINDTIESISDGFKKISKLVVILLLAYVVLEFAVMYPVIPTIVAKILGSKFNVFTTTLSCAITSLFTSEYQYAINMLYSYFTSAYTNSINVISIIFQSTYGLISFIAPSSAMMLVGLSYLDIPYKDWFKYIWKFLVAMLVVIIVMAFVIA